jgi:hypothetical protein
MSQEREKSMSLPVACTLTPVELATMRKGLLPGLLARASAKDAVPGGYRWRFDPRADLVKEAAAVIEAEHRCCRFLRFVLVVEPGDGPVWVEVTGPEGTEQFLSALLDALPTESD